MLGRAKAWQHACNDLGTNQAAPATLSTLPAHLLAARQVCPVLQELVQAMAACDILPPDFPGKDMPMQWCLQLNARPDSYELTPEEARQLSADLEASYLSFGQYIT
jgi:hypothetical protein